MSKNVPNDLKKAIMNYEELYNTCKGTKYEAMVTEVLIK